MTPQTLQSISYWTIEIVLAGIVVWCLTEAWRGWDRWRADCHRERSRCDARVLAYFRCNRLEAQAAILTQQAREAKSTRTRNRRLQELRAVTNQILELGA